MVPHIFQQMCLNECKSLKFLLARGFHGSDRGNGFLSPGGNDYTRKILLLPSGSGLPWEWLLRVEKTKKWFPWGLASLDNRY